MPIPGRHIDKERTQEKSFKERIECNRGHLEELKGQIEEKERLFFLPRSLDFLPEKYRYMKENSPYEVEAIIINDENWIPRTDEEIDLPKDLKSAKGRAYIFTEEGLFTYLNDYALDFRNDKDLQVRLRDMINSKHNINKSLARSKEELGLRGFENVDRRGFSINNAFITYNPNSLDDFDDYGRKLIKQALDYIYIKEE